MDTSEELVISDNPIAEFLKGNIKKIRNEISKTKETINFMSKKTDEVLDEVSACSMGVKLTPPLVKLHRDHYVLWYRMRNVTNKPFQNFEFLLHWNSDEELQYLSSMHPFDGSETDIDLPLIYIDKLVDKAFLVVVFDRPSFLESQSIQIEGFLNYSDGNGGNYVDVLEPVILRSSDVSNKSILSSIVVPDSMNLYSCLVSSFQYDFVLYFETGSSISAALALASLVPYKSVLDRSKRFFVVNDDSYCFNGTILEITSKNELSHNYNVFVYTRDEDSLLAFSHHLHSTMKPVLFLPTEYSTRLLKDNNLEEKRKNLEVCLKKEISTLLDFSEKSQEFYKDYLNKRKSLIDLEYETDAAYVEYRRSENNYSK